MKQNKTNDISYNSQNLGYFSFLKRVFNLAIDRNSSAREIKRKKDLFYFYLKSIDYFKCIIV